MKQKTLPSVRITEHTFEQIKLSLEKLNKNQLIPISIQDFRRLSYLFLSKHILENKDLSDLKLDR